MSDRHISEYMSDPEHRGEYEIPLDELEEMPTLCESQADDLKIDNGDERVWLSRCDTLDGEPYDNKVTIERLVDGRWIDAEYWQAV